MGGPGRLSGRGFWLMDFGCLSATRRADHLIFRPLYRPFTTMGRAVCLDAGAVDCRAFGYSSRRRQCPALRQRLKRLYSLATFM